MDAIRDRVVDMGETTGRYAADAELVASESTPE